MFHVLDYDVPSVKRNTRCLDPGQTKISCAITQALQRSLACKSRSTFIMCRREVIGVIEWEQNTQC